MAVISWVALAFLVNVVTAPFPTDYPGDYCRARQPQQCCPDRYDDCYAEIDTTYCYCDEFCDRNDNPDCCPDFYRVCRGATDEPPPPSRRCYHNGREYEYGKEVKINCNLCTCTTKPESIDETELRCDTKKCMIDSDLMEDINNGYYQWSAGNYSEFWGKNLDDGMIYKLGTLEPERTIKSMFPIRQYYNIQDLPTEFDSRRKWQISGIKDQGWCGASWAFSTAAVASDRLSIQSMGGETITRYEHGPIYSNYDQASDLSPQHMVSCNERGQRGCRGGYLDIAWNFMRRFGIVEEDCYPYTSGDTGKKGNCRAPNKRDPYSTLSCPLENDINYDRNKRAHRTRPAYRIDSKEGDIMNEVYNHGPVQATMQVHHDFFMYRRGVYHATNLRARERTHWHSVRILGWGIENGVKYWLVANSWGRDWGENGTFKIRRGNNECEIESLVVSAWGNTREYRFRP